MDSPLSIRYSIVIPVYNTTKVLATLQQRIETVFIHQIKQSFEVILVDDRSPNPMTWPTIKDIVQKSSFVRGIRLSDNVGQHTALICGLAHARGQFIITMDDDLQHAPEDIPLLIQHQQHAVVMGQFLRKQHSTFRNILSRIKAYFDEVLSGKARDLRISTFCVIQRSTVDQMLAVAKKRHPLLSSLIFMATQDVVGVDVQHSPRQEGQSGYTIVKMTNLFGRLLLNNIPALAQACHKPGKYLLSLGLISLMLSLALLQNIPSWIFGMAFGCTAIGGLLLLIYLFGESLIPIKPAPPNEKLYIIEQYLEAS